jgi:hypothetical protein
VSLSTSSGAVPLKARARFAKVCDNNNKDISSAPPLPPKPNFSPLYHSDR